MAANHYLVDRESSLPIQTAPPTDPRIRHKNVANASATAHHEGICRDYVWGICSKGSACKYRHELHLESMKTILKFCHDYQNRLGCSRPGCTYLHTTNEEENLFLTTGAIPKVLQDRYAAMSSIPNNMYMNDMYITQPPPPPPASTVPSAGAPPPSLPTLLAPPPPPPPPTVATTPIQMTPAIFTGPPQAHATMTSTVYPASQPPDPLLLFDARKPPPALPTMPTAGTSGALKRPGNHLQAGPSKFKKSEESNVENSLCERCVHRELRTEVFSKELHKLECEKDLQAFVYEKKKESYENGKLLLKSAVSPELYRILEEYIESTSQPMQMSDILSQYNQRTSLISSPSNSSRNIFLQMMDLMRNIVEPAPRSSNLFGNDADATIQTFLNMVKNCPTTTTNAVAREPQTPAIASTSEMQSAAPLPSTSALPSGAALSTAPAHAPNGAYVPQTHQHVIHAQKAHPPSAAHPQNVQQAYTQQHVQNVNHAQGHAQNVNHAQSHAHNVNHAQSHAQNVNHAQSHAHNVNHAQSHAQNVNHAQSNAQNVSHAQSHAQNVKRAYVTTTAHSQVAMHPQNASHTQSVTQAQSAQSVMPAAAASAYMPQAYQGATPPLPRPYYPQYATTNNSYPSTSYNMQTRAGAPAQPQARPTSAAAPPNSYPYGMGRYPHSNYYPLYQ